MPQACYIHIPFCSGNKKESTGKCKYCSFVSFNRPELIIGYIYSLLKEINANYKGEKLKTLYFGGGTPSLIPVELLKKVINKFSVDENTEITLELNPENGDYEYLEGLKTIGVNRLSIGSQTFDDDLLQLIGRKHNSKQIINTVNFAKKAGFKNISLDLIYGLPNQTVKSIENDLQKFLELDIQHISTYGLKIEGGSYWGNHPPENLPDDDIQADMYEFINDMLTENGYHRYEVSNFAKTGYESKHNLTYWNNQEYYGFGVSAHGYVEGIRYSNYCTLEKYLNSPMSHEYGRFINAKERLEEEIFLGFRKTDGINVEEINTKFGIDFEQKYKTVLDKYSDYFIKTQKGYAFTFQGTELSNEILPEFLGN